MGRLRIQDELQDQSFISGPLALCGLIVFEILFTLAAYGQSRTVKFRHYLVVHSGEDYKKILSGKYVTDQVAVGPTLFGCLAALIAMTIITYLVLKKWGKIVPGPIITPLFMILTISTVYQNYVGEPYREHIVDQGQPWVRSTITALRAPYSHIESIAIGLVVFFGVIWLSKALSELRLEDFEYRLLLYFCWILCFASCFGTFLRFGARQLQPGEVLKFLALFITGVGYQKIQQKEEIRRLYLATLLLEFAVIFLVVRDFGNAMILGIILLTVLFVTFSLRTAMMFTGAGSAFLFLFFKIYPIIKKDSNITWRVEDTFKGLTQARSGSKNHETRVALFAALKNGLMGGGAGANEYLLNNENAYTDVVFDGIISLFGVMTALFLVWCLIRLINACGVHAMDAGQNYLFYFYANTMMVILGSQAIIHIGGNLNILPFTGIILPFVSRGGTAMLMSFAEIGFALGGRIPDSRVLPAVRYTEKLLNRVRPTIGKQLERVENHVTGKLKTLLKKCCGIYTKRHGS